MSKIDHLLNMHMQMLFPGSASSPALDEWICDLAEVQGHAVGLVTSHSVKLNDLSELKKFAARLDDIQIISVDENLLSYCREYVALLLDLLHSSLIR